jgi:hypothetical protein
MALGLVGCGSGGGGSAVVADPAWVRTEIQHLMDRRARAIENHDLRAFMATVGPDHALRVRQRRYFEDLVQLPIREIAFTVLPHAWPRSLAAASWGSGVHLPKVEVSLELDGYDAHPEVSVTGFAVALRRRGPLAVVSDRTGDGAFFPGYQPEPWDLDVLHVRRQDGVLAVFDDRTLRYASALLPAVAQGVSQDESALPFDWPGQVVVYCFADQRLLDSFRRVPGGNIRDLGGLAFPMYADRDDRTIAGMRFDIQPSSIRAGQPFLGEIVRHELTHVALGARDIGVPTWFVEGIADYLGARPLPRSQRQIAAVALTDAREPLTGMPASSTFNDADQDWHYALSWMACDYIAATDGEATLWDLLDDFHEGPAENGRGTTDAQQNQVLEEIIGMSSQQLATHAEHRILHIYG